MGYLNFSRIFRNCAYPSLSAAYFAARNLTARSASRAAERSSLDAACAVSWAGADPNDLWAENRVSTHTLVLKLQADLFRSFTGNPYKTVTVPSNPDIKAIALALYNGGV